jgi:hypothetical protein
VNGIGERLGDDEGASNVFILFDEFSEEIIVTLLEK